MMARIRVNGFVLAALSAGAGYAMQPTAWLHGRVLDPNHAVMPGLAVTVTGEGQKCTTLSDVRGEFHCKLNPGPVTIGVESFNTEPYQRGPVQLSTGRATFVFVRAVPHPIAPTDAKPTNDAVQIGNTRIVIRAERMERRRDTVTYSGRYVMLMHDNLNVCGERIVCSAKGRKCVVTGRVILDLGWDTLEGDRAEIDVIDRTVSLERAPKVNRIY